MSNKKIEKAEKISVENKNKSRRDGSSHLSKKAIIIICAVSIVLVAALVVGIVFSVILSRDIDYLNDKNDKQELFFKENFIKVTKDGEDDRKIEDLKSKELLQLAYLNGYDINEILKLNDFNFGGNVKINAILFDRYVKQWNKLQSIISGENFFEDLEQFQLLRKGGQEITDVAAMLKINQGLGVTALDKVNFITKIEKMYYDMVHDNYKPIGANGIKNSLRKGSEKMTVDQADAIVKYAKDNDLLNKLDLMRFLKEDEVDYRNVVLAITNSRKYTFNGFDVIDKVEHINTLYQILYYVSEADNSTSDRMKKLLQLKRFISDYNIETCNPLNL